MPRKKTPPADVLAVAVPTKDLPSPVKDNAYILGYDGFIYSTARVDRGFTTRYAAVLLVSATRAPFDIILRNGTTISASAAVVAPMVERQLVAMHGGIVSFHLTPTHPNFRDFVGIAPPGIATIKRDDLSPWDDALSALYDGAARMGLAQRTFDEMVAFAAQLLPRGLVSNPTQIALVAEFVKLHPEVSLKDLAEFLQVPPRSANYLFAQTMGMSLRDYNTWRKQSQVLKMLYSRRSLTNLAFAAGFSDSSQFTRAFQRWFGQTASYSRDPDHVRVFTWDGSNVPKREH